MNRAAICILVIMVGICSSISANAVTNDYVTFETEGKQIKSDSSTVMELDINGTLNIAIDEKKLMSEVVSGGGGVPSGESLQERIELLKWAAGKMVSIQKKLITFKSANIQLRTLRGASQKAVADSKLMQAAVQARDNASNSFSAESTSTLVELQKFQNTDPVLYEELNQAILIDYQAVVSVLHNYLKKLEDQLAKKLEENKCQVLITSKLQGEGRTAFLHLDGYDDIETGAATQFGKFQIALDDRSLRELEEARKLGKFVNSLLDKDFREKVSADILNLKKSLSASSERLWNTEIQREYEELINKYSTKDVAELNALMDKLKKITESVNLLVEELKFDDISSLEQLLAQTDNILKRTKLIQASLVELQEKINAVASSISPTLKKNYPELKNDVDKILGTFLQSLKSVTPELTKNIGEFQDVLASLTTVKNLNSDAEAVSQKAKNLKLGDELDTRLELQLIKISRYPGEQVTITILVSRNNQPLISRKQAFRLEKFGLYWETRGALIFVNPSSNKENLRKVHFQPAPAVSYNLHYGFRNNEFLNRDIAFGIGPSVALLDFSDSSDFEVGIGINITALQGLFWVGFGRNLQARSDYFYVGINPLALANIFQK